MCICRAAVGLHCTMSLFHNLTGDPKIRRQLFWIVCIWIRLIIAAAAVLVVRRGPDAAGIGVGAVVAAMGLFFWFRRCTDNEANIWWYRSVHGLVWFGVGVATAVVAGVGHDSSAAGIVVGVGLGADLLFGILTATLVVPTRNEGPGWIGDGVFPVLFERGWRPFGSGPTAVAVVTEWTLIHIGFGALFGFLVSLAGTGTRPIWGLVATAALFLWEGIENTKPEVVKSFSFRIVRAVGLGSCLAGGSNSNADAGSFKLMDDLDSAKVGPGPDSALNSAADIVFGAVALWLLAYRDQLG